ncbi:MAG: DUF2652 domain-containing protein [Anaerolineales bacterium]
MESRIETRTQHGYLLLADISGYTSFVAGTELEHSQEILSELLELIINRLTPTLTLSKLEGDAVFVYAPEAHLSRGEILLELIEATYIAFKDRVEGIRRRTTCQCNACRAIPTLDLKFLAHHGDYIVQQVSGIKELVGSDVNLVHRLLKNHIAEATGWRAYALFSEKSLEHMGLRPAGLHPQKESYEHLGDVQTYSLNLHVRYKEIIEARRIALPPEDADLSMVQDYAAPPPVVWDWLNDIQKRNLWAEGAGHFSAVERPGGRTGVGARNHCAHGKGESVETILDWRPFDYYTMETREGQMMQLETFRLEPLPNGGTRLHYLLKMRMPLPFALPRWLNRPLVRMMMLQVFKYDKLLADIGSLIERERAAGEPPAETSSAPANA